MSAAKLMKWVSAALVGGALAAGAAHAATAAGKTRKGDELATKSAVLGTAFPDKPFILRDDGVYADYMAAIAREHGRKCKTLESFGWDLKVGDQARLTQIVDVTMDAVQKDGYKADQITAKAAEGTQAVVINATKAKKQGLIVWAPVGKGVVLLVCDAVPGK